MLTHAQKTQIKLAFANDRHPANIAAELGISKEEVDRCLQSARPKATSPYDPNRKILPLRRRRP